MTAPPTLRGVPAYKIFGRALRGDPLGAMGELRRQMPGGVVGLDVNITNLTLAFEPQDVALVFANGRRAHRGLMRTLLGNGLFVGATSEFSRRQRRFLQPAYHQRHLDGQTELMAQTIEKSLSAWTLRPGGESIDMAAAMKQVTIDVTLRSVLGRSAGDTDAEFQRVGEALSFVVEYLDTQLFDRVKLPRFIGLGPNRRFAKAMELLHAIIQRGIDRRRSGEIDGPDLLSMYMKARDAETGVGMSDSELHDEVMSTFVAGVETTGVAVTWTWFLLGQNPAAMAALEAEVDGALGDRLPGPADVAAIPYASMAMREALRLYPVAWAMVRLMDRPVTLGGYDIPENARVIVCPYITQRDPALWPDPDRFDPTRFTPEEIAKRPRFAYFPFGGGGHQCIGREFALLEGQLILAMCAQRYRIFADSPRDVGMSPRIALAPTPHPIMRCVPREAARKSA